MLAAILRCSTILLLLWLPTGCQTPSAVLYDKEDQKLIVYASEDTRSALKEARKHGSISEAIRILKYRLKKKPRDTNYLTSLSRLYLIRGDLDKSEQYAKLVKGINYRDRPAKIILANIAYLRGYYEKAKLILDQIGGERSPERDVLTLLAGVALQKGEDDVSIKLLKLAIKRSPNYIAAHMNLGLIYLKHQEFSLAEQHFQRILQILPGNKDAKLHLGITYAALQKYDKAESLYEDLYSDDPSNHFVIFNIAVLKFRQKNYKGTLRYLKEYVDKAPSRYLARRAAGEIINEIQLDNVRRGGLSDDDIQDLAERLKQDDGQSSEPLSFDQGSELSSGFIFTSVGYIPD